MFNDGILESQRYYFLGLKCHFDGVKMVFLVAITMSFGGLKTSFMVSMLSNLKGKRCHFAGILKTSF